MKAFLTGSRAYGTEKPDSDIDLVVFMDGQTKQGLLEAQGGRYPIRFGDLNIIAVTTENEYAMCLLAKHGCLEQKKKAMISDERGWAACFKEKCVEIHDKARRLFGIPIPSEDECPSKREFEAALEINRAEDQPHKITTPRETY